MVLAELVRARNAASSSKPSSLWPTMLCAARYLNAASSLPYTSLYVCARMYINGGYGYALLAEAVSSTWPARFPRHDSVWYAALGRSCSPARSRPWRLWLKFDNFECRSSLLPRSPQTSFFFLDSNRTARIDSSSMDQMGTKFRFRFGIFFDSNEQLVASKNF